MVAFPRMLQTGEQLAGLTPDLDSVLQYLANERKEQRDLVIKYRAYTISDNTVKAVLTESQVEQFPDGKDPEHKVNLCPVILNTIADRLKVEGITVTVDGEDEQAPPEPPPDEEDTTPAEPVPEGETQGEMLTGTVREWWDASMMDMTSAHLHFSAGRDAEAYLIVEWDADKRRPKFVLEMQDDGVNGGVDIAYDEGSKKPLYATKRWTMRNPDDPLEYKARLNVYYEDRVEKFVSDGLTGGSTGESWSPYEDPDAGNPDPANPHIEWWTDTGMAGGTPLGLPVIHFPVNSDGELTGRSDLADIVPSLCDQLNDASVGLRIAVKLNGFKVRWAVGIDKEASVFETAPGALMTADRPDASFGEFSETNLEQLIKAKDSIARDISTITSVPLPNINPTAQVAAEGTLQQQEAPLIAKVEKRQPVFGNRYEQAVRVAMKAAATFGDLGLSLEQIDELAINVQWKSAIIRNELVDAQRAKLWRENGVPEKIIWREVLGMSTEVIEEAESLKSEGRERSLEDDLARGRSQQFALLQQMGAEARGRRTATNGNGQQEPQAGENPNPGLPQALPGGTPAVGGNLGG